MQLPNVDVWSLRNDGADFGALSILSLGESFLDGMLDDDGAVDSRGASSDAWKLPGVDELALEALGGECIGDDTFPQAPALGGVTAGLRCIDESHALTCTRYGCARWLCTAKRAHTTYTQTCSCSPAPDAPDSVELLGDRGRKNGEKRLRCEARQRVARARCVYADGAHHVLCLERSLITRTPEWNLLSERRKLVPVAHAAGMPALAQALENKKTSALRKAHLLLMARHWGYRSDIWSVRHDRAADRAMEQLRQRAVAQQQAMPLCRLGESAFASAAGVWDESNLAPEAVWLFTRKELRPLSMRVAAAFAGDAAKAAAAAHGAEHITPSAVAEVRKVAELAPGLLAQLGFVHGALTSAQRALPPHLAASPAWQALSAPPFSVAEVMLRGVLEAGISTVSLVARTSSRRLRKGGLSPGEAAWIAEMESSHTSTLALLHQVARVLTAFRAAPLESFLDVAGTLLETIIVLVTSLGSAAVSRERWMRDIIDARGAAQQQSAERAAVLVCWPAKSDELMEMEEEEGAPAAATASS